MNKYESFLNYFDWLIENCKQVAVLPDDVRDIYDSLRSYQETEKPLFTEHGLSILKYLQTCDSKNLKAKDIAEGMDVSSRSVSGAIRKLVTDGFVDKKGSNPIIYSITDKGKEFDIDNYLKEKEKNNGQEDEK